MLNVIATETAANTAAAIAGATGNASKDTGNDNSWDTGGVTLATETNSRIWAKT
ncbi:hypothetical protein [Escherichia coli]|uniref:hypothetical protein n=1 Tax=Escherichia coli TaxID=562 RepID=UPI00208DBB6D|nr:hypothetical protein [Escherichia coli]